MIEYVTGRSRKNMKMEKTFFLTKPLAPISVEADGICCGQCIVLKSKSHYHLYLKMECNGCSIYFTSFFSISIASLWRRPFSFRFLFVLAFISFRFAWLVWECWIFARGYLFGNAMQLTG